jgi:hypothetical protein
MLADRCHLFCRDGSQAATGSRQQHRLGCLSRQTLAVVIVHGTRKFLDRVGMPTAAPGETSTTALGSWYATVLFWKPQVALFVNETSLLPVLVPFAPSASVLDRFPTAVEAVLGRHGLHASFIEAEIAQMAQRRLAATRNRSVIGIMNEFTRLGEAFREGSAALNLEGLATRLAEVPCGPLYQRHISPDRELRAIVGQRC